MSDELPEGWALSTLGHLLECGLFTDGDWVESKDQEPTGDVRLVQLADVGDGVFRDRSRRFLTSAKAAELSCTFLEPGDVLIARMPDPLGRACQFPGDAKRCVTVVDVCIARPAPSFLDSRWLMYAVNAPAFRAQMEEFERGTTRKRISRGNLALLPMPLPPLAEQRRIVAKVEALLARVNEARERLEKVPLLLKRFRQAVLAKAFRGELVPTEAELAAREGRGFESAAQLLRKPGNRAEGNELPEGWMSFQAADLFTYVTSGSRNWSQYYADVGAFFIRITNLDHGSITLDMRDRKYVKLPPSVEGKRTRVQANDLLISITADVGMVALAPPDMGEAYVNQHIALARPNPSLWAEYLAWYFAADCGGQVQLRELQRGATKIGLALDDIKAVWVPLPPIAEQQRIVATLRSLLAVADSLGQAFKCTRSALERAPSAILQKAFAGELVATEAELSAAEGREFESAEELLRRVSATPGAEPSPQANEAAPKRRARPRKTIALGET